MRFFFLTIGAEVDFGRPGFLFSVSVTVPAIRARACLRVAISASISERISVVFMRISITQHPQLRLREEIAAEWHVPMSDERRRYAMRVDGVVADLLESEGARFPLSHRESAGTLCYHAKLLRESPNKKTVLVRVREIKSGEAREDDPEPPSRGPSGFQDNMRNRPQKVSSNLLPFGGGHRV